MSNNSKIEVPNIPLTQTLEDFQMVKINKNLIVICARDIFKIGSETDFGGDFSSNDNVYLYTEGLLLSSTFRLKKGVISAHTVSVAGKGVFDVSGLPGQSPDTPNQNTDEKGIIGGDGDDGGDLSLYVETTDVKSPTFHISANGGSGGEGQLGTLLTPGGDGGNGGNGGNIVTLIGLPYFVWLAKLKQIAQHKSLTDIQKGLTELLKKYPNLEKHTVIMETLTAAIQATALENSQLALENAAYELQGMIAEWNTSLESSIDISSGNYGVYGDGKINGVNGDPGKPGTLQPILFEKPINLINRSFSPFMLIHPSQCTRLLEKIKLMYLTINPVTNSQGVSDILTLLSRLQARTDLFVIAKDDSVLVKYYKDNESIIGSIGAIGQLRHVNAEATRYIDQLKSGSDLYGYDSTHVPLASFDSYNDTLDRLIANFGELQMQYNNYFESLKDNKTEMENIKRTRGSLSEIKSTAQSNLRTLKGILLKQENVIQSYQTTLPKLKKKVTDSIKTLEEDIKSYFDFNFDRLFQSLTSLAFLPESELMIATLASEFVYNGTTKITNDKDIPVNKDYLIRQMKTVTSNLTSLKEGYQSLENGTLTADDPSAGKLIATEQTILSILNDFYSKFPAQTDELKKVFQHYISNVIARNNELLSYNASVLLMLRSHGLINSADDQTEVLNDEALKTISPDLPDLVTFMSSVIYTARNQIMEMLDLTVRAYRFWSLSDLNPLTQLYENKTLPQINYATLLAIKNTLMIDSQHALERFGTNHSTFPRQSDDQGLIYELPSYQLELLQLTNQIMVRIPTVKLGTVLNDKENINIFAGMANVRVRLIRVWIDGVKTANKQLKLHIIHTGKEEICSQTGDVFSFSHEPVSKSFMYNIDTNRVIEEANFGMEQGTSNYAALGPFTTWNIIINPNENDQLDLTEVTGIRLEFHGTHYDFDSSKKES
ncbi:hypothetical protein I6N90_00505 [Paenibacillus sp. GSMTC-2017]|uniref:hypothetical protein n=1 Tax=Paenibacillus sp. GSMTC-2017 TaxID=2794350 RepID=UPI0018D85DA7|nr:hypothetical protein [Paenibacillus sp. GSMTC-2017]MBH5316287.1 hypothetical protein [Paenibacillus sp. GSMTC-2017]